MRAQVVHLRPATADRECDRTAALDEERHRLEQDVLSLDRRQPANRHEAERRGGLGNRRTLERCGLDAEPADGQALPVGVPGEAHQLTLSELADRHGQRRGLHLLSEGEAGGIVEFVGAVQRHRKRDRKDACHDQRHGRREVHVDVSVAEPLEVVAGDDGLGEVQELARTGMPQPQRKHQACEVCDRPMQHRQQVGVRETPHRGALHIKRALVLGALVREEGCRRSIRIRDGHGLDVPPECTQPAHLAQDEGVRERRILADQVADPARAVRRIRGSGHDNGSKHGRRGWRLAPRRERRVRRPERNAPPPGGGGAKGSAAGERRRRAQLDDRHFDQERVDASGTVHVRVEHDQLAVE